MGHIQLDWLVLCHTPSPGSLPGKDYKVTIIPAILPCQLVSRHSIPCVSHDSYAFVLMTPGKLALTRSTSKSLPGRGLRKPSAVTTAGTCKPLRRATGP